MPLLGRRGQGLLDLRDRFLLVSEILTHHVGLEGAVLRRPGFVPRPGHALAPGPKTLRHAFIVLCGSPQLLRSSGCERHLGRRKGRSQAPARECRGSRQQRSQGSMGPVRGSGSQVGIEVGLAAACQEVARYQPAAIRARNSPRRAHNSLRSGRPDALPAAPSGATPSAGGRAFGLATGAGVGAPSRAVSLTALRQRSSRPAASEAEPAQT